MIEYRIVAIHHVGDRHGELEEAQAILQGQLDELREGEGDSDSDGSGDSN